MQLEQSKYKPVAKLKKDLWKVFSMYIRQRDKGVCFTCGKRDEWKNMDAGHYIPKSVGGSNLYFHEKNVHAQCTACNRFRHGNLHEYSIRLQEKYGPGILQVLAVAKKNSRPYSAAELTILINDYKRKLAELNSDSRRSIAA
jgi:Bacteriophage Lambda NinG protein